MKFEEKRKDEGHKHLPVFYEEGIPLMKITKYGACIEFRFSQLNLLETIYLCPDYQSLSPHTKKTRRQKGKVMWGQTLYSVHKVGTLT